LVYQKQNHREVEYNFKYKINNYVNDAFNNFKNFLQNSEHLELSLTLHCNNLVEYKSSIRLLNFEAYKNIDSKYFYITKHEKFYLLQGIKREEVSNKNWLSKTHGVNILKSMFQKLSDNKLEFRKTKHSYTLTQWLLENKPVFLSKLAEELGNYLYKN
jgi:hypothetical protein